MHCKRIIHKIIFILLPLGGAWLGVTSCDSVSCPLNNTVASVYNFYASARGDDGVFVEGQAVSVNDTINITALGPDTLLVNRLVGKSTVSLPVSYYADVDTLEFVFTDKQNRKGADTLWVSKKNLHHFDDPSCPVHLWHTILDVRSTHHLIDTVIISNPAVNYDSHENFQIYFFTANTPDDETEG